MPLLSSLLLLAVLFFLFPFASGSTTTNTPLGPMLWSTWTTLESGAQDYSYCLLVPLLIAYLIFAKRVQLGRLPVHGSTAALGWILLGLAVFWLGSRSGKQFLGEAGIQLLLLGLILWFWGRSLFRPLFFPWIFLVFAWPLPFMDSLVAFPLRLMVSHLANGSLNLIGIPCLQHGTALISAPDPAHGLPLGARFQIDIVDPCSGIHSLFPLLMFSAIYSHLFLSRRWQQWTLFFSAFPLILIGNVVRILLLVGGCLAWGSTIALGTNETPSSYHEGCGLAVFVVVVGLELLLAYLLMRIDRRGRKIEAGSPQANGTGAGADAVPLWRSGMVIGLVALMLAVYAVAPQRYLPPQAGVVMELPTRVILPDLHPGGTFFGLPAPVSEAEHTILPPDTEFARNNYDDFHGHTVFFSIVLSGLQQYTIHRPEVCLVAQGWTVKRTEDVPIRLASGHPLMVRCLFLHADALPGNGDHPSMDALYMYWFVAEEKTTPSYITRNLWSSWDRVLHNRDHRWAYITAMSPITLETRPDGLNEAQTRDMLAAFIGRILPAVQKSERDASSPP